MESCSAKQEKLSDVKLIYHQVSNDGLMQWELIGSGAALLTMFGFVPQIFKIYRTESVEDVSLLMLLQFFVGIFLWLLYGIHIQDKIVIISNVVSFITLVVAIGLYFKYRKNRSRKEN